MLAGHTREHAEQVARAFGWREVSCDWREVVSRADVDLVDVCTPNGLHTQLACAAAEHGKAVVCEKPLATDVEDARKMVEAVGRAGIANTVVFNYRYAPAVRHARDLIVAGELGEVRQLSVHFFQDWLLDPTRPMTRRLSASEGGGVLLDLGAHLVDLVHHLVGPISRVAAASAHFVAERHEPSGTLRPVDVDDAVQALLRADSGALGTLGVSRVAAGYRCQNGFEIVGSRGSVRWEFQRLNDLDVYLAGGPASVRGWRTVSVTQSGVHPWAASWWGAGHALGYAETFVHQLADFLRQRLVGDGQNSDCAPPTFEDGLHCQRVTLIDLWRGYRSINGG